MDREYASKMQESVAGISIAPCRNCRWSQEDCTCFRGRLISIVCVLALSCSAMEAELSATAQASTVMDANTPSVSSANSLAAVASASTSMLSREPPKSRPAHAGHAPQVVALSCICLCTALSSTLPKRLCRKACRAKLQLG